MKVLLVSTSFPRWSGDTRAPFIYEAARAIKNEGIEVKVLTMHFPGAEKNEIWDGIDIQRVQYLPERFENLQRESGGIPVSWKKSLLSRLEILPFIISLAAATVSEARKFDLIHANWTISAGAAWITKWIHKKSYIVTVHGSDIFQAGKISLVRWMTGIVLRHAAKVIAVSSALAEAVKKLGVQHSRIEIIPDGVDLNRFHPPSSERESIILSVGALTDIKGGDLLLRAFPKVLENHPDYRLVMIGDGPRKEDWVKLTDDLGISEHVMFTGACSQEEVAEWMRRATLFVLPSRSEGLGVVLLEALASGTPCIGANVGGIPDVIDGEVGELFQPNKSNELEEAIIKMLSDSKILASYSNAATSKAERVYAWNKVAKRILDQYAILLGLSQCK